MAEGNGLLNRRRDECLYRGFESRPLRSIGDAEGHEVSKCSKDKGIAAGTSERSHRPESLSELPNDNSTGTKNVCCSDRLDAKQDHKRATGPDWAEIVEAWAALPSVTRSGIVAIVRAFRERQDGPCRMSSTEMLYSPRNLLLRIALRLFLIVRSGRFNVPATSKIIASTAPIVKTLTRTPTSSWLVSLKTTRWSVRTLTMYSV